MLFACENVVSECSLGCVTEFAPQWMLVSIPHFQMSHHNSDVYFELTARKSVSAECGPRMLPAPLARRPLLSPLVSNAGAEALAL
jgi:hypothetical protein